MNNNRPIYGFFYVYADQKMSYFMAFRSGFNGLGSTIYCYVYLLFFLIRI